MLHEHARTFFFFFLRGLPACLPASLVLILFFCEDGVFAVFFFLSFEGAACDWVILAEHRFGSSSAILRKAIEACRSDALRDAVRDSSSWSSGLGMLFPRVKRPAAGAATIETFKSDTPPPPFLSFVRLTPLLPVPFSFPCFFFHVLLVNCASALSRRAIKTPTAASYGPPSALRRAWSSAVAKTARSTCGIAGRRR